MQDQRLRVAVIVYCCLDGGCGLVCTPGFFEETKQLLSASSAMIVWWRWRPLSDAMLWFHLSIISLETSMLHTEPYVMSCRQASIEIVASLKILVKLLSTSSIFRFLFVHSGGGVASRYSRYPIGTLHTPLAMR
jgi:hypothetical protein